jgi:hypothetical protein
MSSYKDLSELAGYTARVSLLLDTMQDIRHGKFEKARVTTGQNEYSKAFFIVKFNAYWPSVLQGRGQVIEADDIQFEGVPIVTPNGDDLEYVHSRYFYTSSNPPLLQQHLLIVGPNGENYSHQFISVRTPSFTLPFSQGVENHRYSAYSVAYGLYTVELFANHQHLNLYSSRSGHTYRSELFEIKSSILIPKQR